MSNFRPMRAFDKRAGYEVRNSTMIGDLKGPASVKSPVRGNWPERLTVLSRVNRLELRSCERRDHGHACQLPYRPPIRGRLAGARYIQWATASHRALGCGPGDTRIRGCRNADP